MTRWSITVPGRVVPLARGRHSNKVVRNEKSSLEYQSRLIIAMRLKMRQDGVLSDSLDRDAKERIFHRETPISVFLVFHGPKVHLGDGDNMQKSVFDAITKAGVWYDDKQVDLGLWHRPVGGKVEKTEIHIFDDMHDMMEVARGIIF